MRKILAIAVLFLVPIQAFATFGSASAWDVRTTGLDTNGGAFDSGVGSPGTDESQGAGTAITITLASGTTGTGSPAFSSTTHGPGNFVHIASGAGCTTGWFEVLSQSGGTATFDHSMGSASNVCTGTIGGSLLTIGQANTNHIAGNAIYIQKGTYTLTSTISSSTNPDYFLGYNSTHGDLDGTAWSTWSANVPLITTSTNSTALFSLSGNTTHTFRNLSMSNTAGTRADGISVSGAAINLTVSNVIMDGFSIALDGSNRFDPLILTNAEIKNWTTSAIVENNTGGTPTVFISDSWIHTGSSGTSPAINFLAVNVTFITRVIISNSLGTGITYPATGLHYITASTIANNAGDNINLGLNGNLVLENSILYGSTGGYGINGLSPTIFMLNYNGFGGNSLGNAHGTGISTGLNPISLSANPFTSSTNFALNSTAGGGASAKGAGFPGVFPGGSTTGAPDIGAVQSNAGGGSGGSGVYAYTN